MNQKITKYDCINLCYNGLRAFYADYEIDVDSVINNPRFGFGGTKLTKGIEANRKAKGKVFTRIDDGFTHPKTGNEYPNFTASLNGGSITGVFSCWDYLKDSSANNESFTPRIAPKVAPVAIASNNDDARKLAEFNALRDLLPTLPTERGNFAYMVEKFGVYAELATQNAGLKRGVNSYGEFIAYPLTQTIGGDTCCIQTIGANGFKIIRNAYEGAKVGAFYVLGNIRHAHKGIQFVEGLASGLTARYATGLVTVICLDAGNLPVVVKKFSDWGYKNLIVCPDNDIKPDKPNTGLIAAFKAVQGVPAASVFIPYLDGVKCDFNDIHKAKGIDEVRRQLNPANALNFENGKLCVNKRVGKTAAAKREYERYYESFLAEALPEQNETSRAKIIKSLLDDCPRFYAPEQAIAKAEKYLKFESDKQKLRAEIIAAYHAKGKVLTLRNSLTEADLRGCIRIDLANHDDVARLHNVARYDRATFIDFRPMGSGKTELIGEIISNDLDSLSSAIIVPRVSLSHDLATRLKTSHYKSEGRDKYTAQVLSVCVNSIMQFKLSKEFQHCFIDEMRLVLESVLDGATMKDNLSILNELTAIIQNTRITWGSDADFNALSLDFLRNAAPDKPIYYVVDSRPKTHKLQPVIYRGGSLDTLLLEILERLNNGQKLYICTDSLQQVHKVKNFLKSKGIKEHRILDVHSKNKGDFRVKEFLNDPNTEAKKYDAVIVSPVVQCGFSICNGWFNAVIGLLGSGSCTSNEIAQSLYRVRDAKEIVIGITPQKNRNRVMSLNLFLDGEVNTRHRISDDGTLIVELDELSQRHYRALAQRNADLNDLENSILLHLENIGFEVTHAIPEPAAVQKIIGLTEAVKAEQAKEILAADSITSTSFKELSANSQNFTSEQSRTADRHMVEDMIGATAHTPEQLEQLEKLRDSNADPVTEKHITDFQSGMLARILKRELMLVDVDDLKELDRENHNKGKRNKRKSVDRMLIDDLLVSVEKNATNKSFTNEKTGATKASGRAFDKTTAAIICDEVLRANCAELAANGYSDYSKPPERPVQTLRNIFKQYGYNLNCVGRDGDGDRLRWFEIVEDDEISTHVANREINRKTKPVQ
jgi:phage/plasmid primase-like uncharacterized protein